jgi:NTP pyrophosphatase (non-canonical NTP hydrolase)
VNFADYQIGASRTLARRPLSAYQRAELDQKLAVMGLGLGGEAGEVLDLLKKTLGHGQPLDLEKVKKELGDVLWYVAAIATLLGLELDAVAEANLAKLRARYPNGFSEAASVERVDEKGAQP